MSRSKLPLYLLPFLVLAVLNSGGYRYGASDQAFYLPVVLAKLDPGLYPRDAAVIAAQARLTTYDEVVALIVRMTGASVPVIFGVLHLASLTLIALGTWLVAKRVYRTEWACVALLAAMTLRHAIARSGTNTLEGYFHPRQLAFGLGLIAVAMFLRGRFGAVAVLVAAAALLHPTAALWFAIWLGAAAAIASRPLRRWLTIAALPSAAVGAWILTAGPLAGRLGVMDADWLRMLSTKEYLFVLQWPLYAWILNLGYIAVVAWIYIRRRRAGLVDERERALALGIFSLAIVFLLFLIMQAMHVVLSFQLQPARLFLMFDVLATVYAVWVIAEGHSGRGHPVEAGCSRPHTRPDTRRAQLAALGILAFSIARSVYVSVEIDRPVIQMTIPDDDWGRAMAWARGTDRGTGWLADPMHAILYGTSVRVAGERDVFIEAVKDAALGLYDRAIADRTDTRMRELDDFNSLSADEARRFGARYGLDYLVTQNPIDLPLAFESGAIRIYRLR